MLPPFIIEQIRKREEQERAQRDVQRPRLELPIESYRPASGSEDESVRDEYDIDPTRGVVIIQF